MTGEVILYQTADGAAQISLRAMDGTVWLSQAEMAALFDTAPQAMTQLIKTIYADGELTAEATCKELLQVRQDAARKQADAAQADTDDLAAIEALAKDLSRDRGKG